MDAHMWRKQRFFPIVESFVRQSGKAPVQRKQSLRDGFANCVFIYFQPVVLQLMKDELANTVVLNLHLYNTLREFKDLDRMHEVIV